MPTPYDRALDELGKTRSDLAAYIRHNAKQQRRIRELENGLNMVYQTGLIGIAQVAAANYPEREKAAIKNLQKAYDAAIKKGK